MQRSTALLQFSLRRHTTALRHVRNPFYSFVTTPCNALQPSYSFVTTSYNPSSNVTQPSYNALRPFYSLVTTPYNPSTTLYDPSRMRSEKRRKKKQVKRTKKIRR